MIFDVFLCERSRNIPQTAFQPVNTGLYKENMLSHELLANWKTILFFLVGLVKISALSEIIQAILLDNCGQVRCPFFRFSSGSWTASRLNLLCCDTYIKNSLWNSLSQDRKFIENKLNKDRHTVKTQTKKLIPEEQKFVFYSSKYWIG